MKSEQYQIINKNKLIAEFMGLETATFIPSGHLNYYHKERNSGTWYEVHELSYNLSWDWLMSVVEKIENFGFEIIIAESRCKIKHNTDHSIKELLNLEIMGSKIDVTYRAVVEFINQNK